MEGVFSGGQHDLAPGIAALLCSHRLRASRFAWTEDLRRVSHFWSLQTLMQACSRNSHWISSRYFENQQLFLLILKNAKL
ncbi:hypothetical protein [Pantoea sp. 18069]|uniref:hypothetical protein n=1 Tax=Pantoea sp. 18069 TaxID=2681415 RepID=UPI001358DA98|nr:hypothetical protein [Pantoea sp. 18069]